MDSLLNILYAIRDLAISIARLMYLWEQLKQSLHQLFPHKQTQSTPQRKLNQKYSHSYRTDPKNRELQQRLLTLLHGDVATGMRLLKRERQLNRGQSDNWYLEKVIYDLERDRLR